MCSLLPPRAGVGPSGLNIMVLIHSCFFIVFFNPVLMNKGG